MNEGFARRIRKALAARYRLVYVRCHEERRLQGLLAALATERAQGGTGLHVWTSTSGLQVEGEGLVPPGDALAALRFVAGSGRDGFYLFKDLPAQFAADPSLVRALRDLYDELAERDCFVFLSSPRLCIPDELAHQMFYADLGIPTEDEIRAELLTIAGRSDVVREQTEAWFDQVAVAMKGMMLNEVRHVMWRLIAEQRLGLEAALADIHEEKGAALMREGCLKFIVRSVEIDQVGGLENLKEWVLSRKAFFTRTGMETGAPLPSGVLFMGVSGCGKSMAAKVIASAWNLPLVRLDMNLVLSGAYGSPEYAFDHALRVAEQIAPLVLWIDEMENSFGYDMGARGAGNQNIFSSFLTWMQEKPSTVFVVATANRIEKLPAEVIRKGRFDQLFFLDLPTEEERRRIVEIHIEAAGADPASFNLGVLAAVTKNWSGAEIEQAIRSAVVHAYEQGRPFNERDVMWSTSRMVPLSRTMEEQIKQLRVWSQERATPASRKPA
ncbi:MAG: AAA family ATPase [Rhodocyclaceae bacterium]|jgi:AAA+ superfamily predicted ATPase|nr:AAA family ATPase [Rhodocyclaceae bacterium]MCL4758446.1 AAA family ATPase [Rhodocyclaceae bacterium]